MSNPIITIVDTTPEHLRMMVEVMRAYNINTAIKLGISPRKALWKSWKQSIFAKTAFVNGEIAAIWGISGTCFSDVGLPWLILAPCADEYPFKIAFAFKREIEKMSEMFPELMDFVDRTDNKARRLLELMGFSIKHDIITRGDQEMLVARRTRK